jgi:hypothetical protein
MMIVATHVSIRASPEQVWAVLIDFASYREWNPFICEASGEPIAGARLRVCIRPPGGKALEFRPVVKEASEGRRLKWLGHFLAPGLFDGHHTFAIDAGSAGEVLFRQEEEFRGVMVHLFPASMYEATRRGFETMNQALKRRVESLTASRLSHPSHP